MTGPLNVADGSSPGRAGYAVPRVHPYAKLPTPAQVDKALRRVGSLIADQARDYGRSGAHGVIRGELAALLAGRASSPADVRAQREWLDVAAADALDAWQADREERRAAGRPSVADAILDEHVAAGDLDDTEAVQLRIATEAARVRRLTTGGAVTVSTCAECGTVYVPARSDSTTCSARCRTARSRRRAAA